MGDFGIIQKLSIIPLKFLMRNLGLIEYNVQNNQKNFPKYLLTNSNKAQNCFWPDYQYLNTTVMLCDTFEYLK